MPTFLKICVPFIILLLFHFFYLNGKKLMKDQDIYRLKKVSFIGVEASDPYEIIEGLGLEKGINLLFLDTEELTQKIKAIPRYRDAEVILQYPDTLILKLEEKKTEYIVKVNGMMYSVDASGEITERSHEIKDYDFFFIEATDFQNLQEVLSNNKFKEFIQLAQDIPDNERGIFQLFSGVELSRFNKDWILYGHSRKVKFNMGKDLSLGKLRKTLYAYMYGKYKEIPIKNVFITEDLVYFNQ